MKCHSTREAMLHVNSSLFKACKPHFSSRLALVQVASVKMVCVTGTCSVAQVTASRSSIEMGELQDIVTVRRPAFP